MSDNNICDEINNIRKNNTRKKITIIVDNYNNDYRYTLNNTFSYQFEINLGKNHIVNNDLLIKSQINNAIIDLINKSNCFDNDDIPVNECRTDF